MPAADGAHRHDLPREELHPVVLPQDPGLGHPVVLGHGEQALKKLHAHGRFPLSSSLSGYHQGVTEARLER
jgi:hypothetical protein